MLTRAVEEVFGRDIAKAKTTADRVKIAQEILKSAREEQDMAVRFAALQGARRLAVEALDGKLGLEIVREIDDPSYQIALLPEETSSQIS